MAAPGKLLPKIREIENFAVERDHIASARRGHGLMPVWREIEDGKPAKAERHAGVRLRPGSMIVRAAMDDLRRHPLGHGFEVASRAAASPETGDPAHASFNLVRAAGRTR